MDRRIAQVTLLLQFRFNPALDIWTPWWKPEYLDRIYASATGGYMVPAINGDYTTSLKLYNVNPSMAGIYVCRLPGSNMEALSITIGITVDTSPSEFTIRYLFR